MDRSVKNAVKKRLAWELQSPSDGVVLIPNITAASSLVALPIR